MFDFALSILLGTHGLKVINAIGLVVSVWLWYQSNSSSTRVWKPSFHSILLYTMYEAEYVVLYAMFQSKVLKR